MAKKLLVRWLLVPLLLYLLSSPHRLASFIPYILDNTYPLATIHGHGFTIFFIHHLFLNGPPSPPPASASSSSPLPPCAVVTRFFYYPRTIHSFASRRCVSSCSGWYQGHLNMAHHHRHSSIHLDHFVYIRIAIRTPVPCPLVFLLCRDPELSWFLGYLYSTLTQIF